MGKENKSESEQINTMEDKILELENKLKEMEKKYNENREILEDLIYHFMYTECTYNLGKTLNTDEIPRDNFKKGFLKILIDKYDIEDDFSTLFDKVSKLKKEYDKDYKIGGGRGDNAYKFINKPSTKKQIKELAEKYKVSEKSINNYLGASPDFDREYDHFLSDHNYREYIDKKRAEKMTNITKMTEKECEEKLNEFLKEIINEDIKENIESRNLKEKIEMLKERIIAIGEYRYYWIFDRVDKAFEASEDLWSIYYKIREKKELEKEQFKERILKPYKEKYYEISQEIEEQEKAKKLEEIKEKEAELEKMKKEI